MVMNLELPAILAFGFPGGLWEWLLIAAVGLLLFGKRLPEVGRSLGRGIVEFKKGLKGVEDDIETADQPKGSLPPQGFKFDPYTGKPIGSASETGNRADA